MLWVWLWCLGLVVAPALQAAKLPMPAEDGASTPVSLSSATEASREGTDELEALDPHVEVAPVSSPEPERRTLATEAQARELCEAFMQLIITGQVDEAFTRLAPYFPVPDDQVAHLKEQTQGELALVGPRFGRSTGAVWVDASIASGTVMRVRFLQKFEHSLLQWTFVLYHPQDGWVMNALAFDDEVERLFAHE